MFEWNTSDMLQRHGSNEYAQWAEWLVEFEGLLGDRSKGLSRPWNSCRTLLVAGRQHILVCHLIIKLGAFTGPLPCQPAGCCGSTGPGPSSALQPRKASLDLLVPRSNILAPFPSTSSSSFQQRKEEKRSPYRTVSLGDRNTKLPQLLCSSCRSSISFLFLRLRFFIPLRDP